MPGRLKALFLLGGALLWTLVKRALRWQASGLARFLEQYDADGLCRVTAQERRELPAHSRCIACGRCTRHDAAVRARSRGAFPGTMEAVLAAPRSMPDFQASARAFAWLSPAELEAREALCPVDVPIGAIARFVAARAAGVSGPPASATAAPAP